jgi:probable aminopeptidase NPEPL1
MPTNHLDTKIYQEKIKVVVADLVKQGFPVEIKVIKDTELRDGGFGGIWGVGKAAEEGPAMVILTFTPPKTSKTVCWVGKGIVYDTGGLSIKVGGNMCGMKTDMGGSAAVLGAFQAYVQTSKTRKSEVKLHAILCLADNAVGPSSYRNDDVLNMYSGKTVEINNTDAEGRLVLGDGVAYATRDLKADVVVDVATLTGAAMVNTGIRHAGVVSNDEAGEKSMVAAGKTVGTLCFPMMYVSINNELVTHQRCYLIKCSARESRI